METIIKDKMVNHQWSPEQIVGWCRSQTIKRVSHERVYQYVLKDKQAGGLLFKNLRTGQKVYKKRYGSKDLRGVIHNKISIDDRPDIAQKKNELEILKST